MQPSPLDSLLSIFRRIRRPRKRKVSFSVKEKIEGKRTGSMIYPLESRKQMIEDIWDLVCNKNESEIIIMKEYEE